ncbi:MAG TPA: IclR family transcriptional regulator [Baekduia sp.]|nr:IclR family transcriptional regulator [Baekduia sp.]
MAEISKTTDQALVVVLELSEKGPMTAAALSRSLGINRTVVHRLLTTLHRRGFVTRLKDGYAPGAAFMRIAEGIQPELRGAARAVLVDLASKIKETIVLQISDGDDTVVLEQVVSTEHVLRVEHRIGSRHPLDKGAGGRALLAFASDDKLERFLQHMADRQTLIAELEEVRRQGFAESQDELQLGVHGLGVPVFGASQTAIASLSLLVPIKRASVVADHIGLLRDGAARISATLQADLNNAD